MKNKWRLLALVCGLTAVVLVGVVAVTGVQCCSSSANNTSFSGGDRTPSHNELATAASPDNIGVYSVPLRCPLVSGLGCGSESKPIMTRLDTHSAVAGTWLNHAGTILTVLWKDGTDAKQRSQAVASAFQGYRAPSQLSDDDREVAMRDFLSGVGWYRTAALDELSGQEADIVATRWVGKITAIIPLPKKMREMLHCKLSEKMRSRFVGK